MFGAQNSSVIDASNQFYQKRYDYEFLWRPSLEIEEAIERAIFGGNG